MTRAADYGLPRIRVRLTGEVGGTLRKGPAFEVEFTPVGASAPAWTRTTTDPVGLLAPALGQGDAHAVVDAVRQAGSGVWRSLFDADE